jgi:outer membrane protein OmpA-like peptidoglycan-associated protein
MIETQFTFRKRTAAALLPALLFQQTVAVGCKGSASPKAEATALATAGTSAAPPAAPSEGQAQPGSLAERLAAVQSGQADGTGNKPVLPAWKPAKPGMAVPAIPLVRGLQVVTAISDLRGDYESIKSIEGVSPSVVQMHYSADVPSIQMTGALKYEGDQIYNPKNQFPDHVSCTRLIDAADLASAHSYSEIFCENPGVEHFSGSTSIGASTEMLNQLRAGQQVEFHFTPESKWVIFEQLGAQLQGHGSGEPPLTRHAGQQMYSCNLHRAEAEDLAAPVLLNGQRVELPALHAMCTLDGGEEAHLYYLDQPANPITLAFQLGPASVRLQLIKILLPSPEERQAAAPAKPSEMEQALAAKKPVEVYGIYFDFNSAKIKPESEGVLQQIAEIMQKNPDWKLDVAGHTDNIGGDEFNLGLSQRRAGAVKDALVKRYRIAPDRLATAGYGASRPIETNTTMEGRARNRRVELQRL